jgi:hypothetical protein
MKTNNQQPIPLIINKVYELYEDKRNPLKVSPSSEHMPLEKLFPFDT